MMTPIAKANKNIVLRYITKLKQFPPGDPNELTSPSYLLNMCQLILDHPDMYDDKQSRWLGCIQGIMLAQGLLDVDRERDLTRPIFHEAYEIMGLSVPQSLSVKKSRKD